MLRLDAQNFLCLVNDRVLPGLAVDKGWHTGQREGLERWQWQFPEFPYLDLEKEFLKTGANA